MNEHLWMQAYSYNQEHMQQLQREADQRRMAQEARQKHSNRRLIARMLYALGQQFYHLGQRLQHQYQPVHEHRITRPATGS